MRNERGKEIEKTSIEEYCKLTLTLLYTNLNNDMNYLRNVVETSEEKDADFRK